MFGFQDTLAAKAIEQQQLGDHNSDVGDNAPLLGRADQLANSLELSNRYCYKRVLQALQLLWLLCGNTSAILAMENHLSRTSAHHHLKDAVEERSCCVATQGSMLKPFAGKLQAHTGQQTCQPARLVVNGVVRLGTCHTSYMAGALKMQWAKVPIA